MLSNNPRWFGGSFCSPLYLFSRFTPPPGHLSYGRVARPASRRSPKTGRSPRGARSSFHGAKFDKPIFHYTSRPYALRAPFTSGLFIPKLTRGELLQNEHLRKNPRGWKYSVTFLIQTRFEAATFTSARLIAQHPLPRRSALGVFFSKARAMEVHS